jgi:hypothetical protein
LLSIGNGRHPGGDSATSGARGRSRTPPRSPSRAYGGGRIAVLLVTMIALGVASFAGMLAFVRFCDWV